MWWQAPNILYTRVIVYDYEYNFSRLTILFHCFINYVWWICNLKENFDNNWETSGAYKDIYRYIPDDMYVKKFMILLQWIIATESNHLFPFVSLSVKLHSFVCALKIYSIFFFTVNYAYYIYINSHCYKFCKCWTTVVSLVYINIDPKFNGILCGPPCDC